MIQVTVRFYEELNFFLKPEQRKTDIPCAFPHRRSVKDLVESLGVPHPEIDLILVSGESVGFDYIVKDGDRISVYPVFERLDISSVTRLRPAPLRNPKFILDVHLKTLARKLRMLGFDTDWQNHRDDATLAAISEQEDRILLTRDKGLLMRSNVTRGLYVRNTDPRKQLREIVDRLDLKAKIRPLGRCIRCNGEIDAIEYGSREYEIHQEHIPHSVRRWCRTFSVCRTCGKIYWRASHVEKMIQEIEDLYQ
jgi:uncharacterized protein